MDENGWPIDVRVGRHTSSILQTLASWSEMYPEKPIACRNVPRYAEVIRNGTGYYLHDPSRAEPKRVVFE